MHRSSEFTGLEALGWDAEFAEAFARIDPAGELVPARVCEEQRGRYQVRSAAGDWSAEVSGRLGYLAAGPEDWPAVGDWVAVSPRPAEAAATIHFVLPRRTALLRGAAGEATRAQVLAANVETVLLVTSANRDFNRRRIERALAVVQASGARAVVLLSKRDLCADPAALVAQAREVAAGAPVLALSAATGEGLDALAGHLPRGRTAVLLGSSGVGKSTLVNRLAGRELQATREVREDDDRGRHATSHRQLFALPGGALLIDTPGLRELGLWEEGEGGLAGVFPELKALARACRFRDCRHRGEPGCAVGAAIEDSSLDPSRLESQRKLERELRHLRERRDAAGRHAQRQRMRRFKRAQRSRPDKRST